MSFYNTAPFCSLFYLWVSGDPLCLMILLCSQINTFKLMLKDHIMISVIHINCQICHYFGFHLRNNSLHLILYESRLRFEPVLVNFVVQHQKSISKMFFPTQSFFYKVEFVYSWIVELF